jgi:hypothetical protein
LKNKTTTNTVQLMTPSLHPEYLALAPLALWGELTPEQQIRFDELLATYVDCATDFAAQHTTLEVMSRRLYPTHSNEYWNALAASIDHQTKHIGKIQGLDSSESTRVPQHSPAPRRTSVRLLFAKKMPSKTHTETHTHTEAHSFHAKHPFVHFVLGAALAAAAFGGFFIGRWSVGSTVVESPQTSSNLARASSASEREVQEFLQQAHLLFVGVMNMSAECSVSNPHTLTAQRHACMTLLFKVQHLRGLQSFESKPELVRLVGEIEATLAEIAAVEPEHFDAVRIRALQTRSDYTLCELSSAVASIHGGETR